MAEQLSSISSALDTLAAEQKQVGKKAAALRFFELRKLYGTKMLKLFWLTHR